MRFSRPVLAAASVSSPSGIFRLHYRRRICRSPVDYWRRWRPHPLRKAGSQVAVARSLLLVQLTGAWTNYFFPMRRLSDFAGCPGAILCGHSRHQPSAVRLRHADRSLICVSRPAAPSGGARAGSGGRRAVCSNTSSPYICRPHRAWPSRTNIGTHAKSVAISFRCFPRLPTAAFSLWSEMLQERACMPGMLATLIVGAIRTAAFSPTIPSGSDAVKRRMCGSLPCHMPRAAHRSDRRRRGTG